MKKYQLVKQENFGAVRCDFYQGSDDFYMTREQIGSALEYANPRESIKTIHSRYRERLDQFSRRYQVDTPSGKQETVFYTRKGVMEVCRHSHQPKADAFIDFTWDIMDDLLSGRAILLHEKGTPEWQQARLETKDFRRMLNDTIKELLPYAAAQGSTNYDRLYMSYSVMIKKIAGYTALDLTDREMLSTVTMMLRLVRGVVLQEMALNTHYKTIFQRAKDQLSQVMAVWVPRLAT